MYLQTMHGLPIVGGYVSASPPYVAELLESVATGGRLWLALAHGLGHHELKEFGKSELCADGPLDLATPIAGFGRLKWCHLTSRANYRYFPSHGCLNLRAYCQSRIILMAFFHYSTCYRI